MIIKKIKGIINASAAGVIFGIGLVICTIGISWLYSMLTVVPYIDIWNSIPAFFSDKLNNTDNYFQGLLWSFVWISIGYPYLKWGYNRGMNQAFHTFKEQFKLKKNKTEVTQDSTKPTSAGYIISIHFFETNIEEKTDIENDEIIQ